MFVIAYHFHPRLIFAIYGDEEEEVVGLNAKTFYYNCCKLVRLSPIVTSTRVLYFRAMVIAYP